MSDRFRLVFAGDVLEGHRVEDVQRKMAELLHLSQARQDSMFSGKRTVLKKGMAFDDATRYVAKFERIGAKVLVEPDESETRADLAESRRDDSVPASEPSPRSATAKAPASAKAPPRRAVIAAGAAVVVLAVLAGAGWYVWGGGSPVAPQVTEERLGVYGLTAEARTIFRSDYWPAGGNKAFAASTGGAWGYVAGAASDQEAAQRALADCEGRRKPEMAACRLVNLTGNWAPVGP